MNQHLNVFRFFNEDQSPIFIEKNLSRAFAICLTHESFFLNEYIRNIVSAEDYQYLFSSVNTDTVCTIDIEIDTANKIERENFKKVYAIAMTSDRNISMDDFFDRTLSNEDKRNVTDVFISIKDIAIIIEVKRTWEDCKQQLFNQLWPFYSDKDRFIIEAKRFSWAEVVGILEKIRHINQLSQQSSVFINHFLELSGARFPEWFEPKPFNVIPFSTQNGAINSIQLDKRIRQALTGVAAIAGDKYQLLPYNDRIGITLPFVWASELIPGFELHPDDHKEYVTFYIWPGNTKQQGYSIFDKPLGWMNKTNLTIDGEEYPMEITYNIKFSHFMGKYVSGINFYDDNVFKRVHTSDNFYHKSGKWTSETWQEFEQFMDEHFKPEFNWRKACDWEKKFLQSDRSYLFMSLGFEVSVSIPYSKFKAMDKTEVDIVKVSEFIRKIAMAYQSLI
ncbi:MAG: hypothetical protein MUC81_13580 [Bacteroidia bacterium]|jgi:hypothetical protein|nr:hypothetical protein [Bacteroidia bacterium]